jgi:hypothetical protein
MVTEAMLLGDLCFMDGLLAAGVVPSSTADSNLWPR